MITGRAHFIVLCFIALHRYCVRFYKLDVCGNPASSKSTGDIFHFCVSVSHFGNSHNISVFSIIILFVMVTCDQWFLSLL